MKRNKPIENKWHAKMAANTGKEFAVPPTPKENIKLSKQRETLLTPATAAFIKQQLKSKG